MKTPIAYYGGKQQLAGKIVRILAQAPAQKIYCEPFFGGGAVFFARGGAEAIVTRRPAGSKPPAAQTERQGTVAVYIPGFRHK